MVADYKLHKLKNDTKIIYFQCAYCGKYQYRRLSKVRNKNLIFCDNTCRAKYFSIKSIRRNILSQDIKSLYERFLPQIKMSIDKLCKLYDVKSYRNELLNESQYICWRILCNTSRKVVDKKYFAKYMSKGLKAFCIEWLLKKNLYLFDYDYDKCLSMSIQDNVDDKIDCIYYIKQYIDKIPKSAKIYIASQIGYSDEEIKNMTGYNKKQVIKNKSYGKKYMKNIIDKN